MTDLIEVPALSANEQAIALIDKAMVDVGGRSLIDTNEMADILLDLRAFFSKESLS